MIHNFHERVSISINVYLKNAPDYMAIKLKDKTYIIQRRRLFSNIYFIQFAKKAYISFKWIFIYIITLISVQLTQCSSNMNKLWSLLLNYCIIVYSYSMQWREESFKSTCKANGYDIEQSNMSSHLYRCSTMANKYKQIAEIFKVSSPWYKNCALFAGILYLFAVHFTKIHFI